MNSNLEELRNPFFRIWLPTVAKSREGLKRKVCNASLAGHGFMKTIFEN